VVDLAILDAGAMRRWSALLVIGAVLVGLAAAAVAFFVLPNRLVDDKRFAKAASDASIEQKRLEARNDVRAVGVQLVAAAALIVGGALTWRTVWLTREGQITDRLAEAVARLGEDEKVNVRVGAIYALGRVARDSRVDHPAVMALLGEHLRATHPAVDEDGRRLELTSRRGVDPEVRAVAVVLHTRRAEWDPKQSRLNFSGIDFRNAPLEGVDLRRANLRKSNFRGAFLSDADLRGAWLQEATLGSASLQRCKLNGAELTGAELAYAHAERASFRAAVLDEVSWQSTDLCGADLRAATGLHQTLPTSDLVLADTATRWPWERSGRWQRA
jgi:hypothetical protein